MSTAEYLPGAWSAAVRPGFVALVAGDAPSGTARALWDASGDGIVACLGVLAHDGFAGLPGFAIAHLDGARAHLALRGAVTAEVGTASGTRVVRSGDVGTWTEQVLEDVTSVRLVADADAGAGADQAAALPLVDGVVRAGEIRVGADSRPAGDSAPTHRSEGADAATSAPALVDVPDFGSSPAHTLVTPTALTAPAAPADDLRTSDASAPDGLPADELPADELPADEVPADEVPADESAVDPAPTAHAPEQLAAPGLGLVDGADAVSETDAVTGADAAPQPGPSSAPVPSVVDVAPEPAPALVALGAPEADVESTVDDVRTLVGPSSQDDHDGMTILSSDLAQIREQLPAWAAQWPNEGATPGPFAVPSAVATMAAPRIVLSTGVDVPLDRTVLLGRAPQVARVTNRELPRLVAVPSPQQDISRTHAEVRAEGEHVLVTDLHSTNGVHVSRQGEGARRLHPGEASVVAPGEVVDLGDGVTFTVERGQ